MFSSNRLFRRSLIVVVFLITGATLPAVVKAQEDADLQQSTMPPLTIPVKKAAPKKPAPKTVTKAVVKKTAASTPPKPNTSVNTAHPVAPASTVKAPVAAAAWTGNGSREFSLAGQSVKEKSGLITVNGEVLITSLETKFKADTVTFDRAAQVATSAGKFQFDDVQHTLFGNGGNANYKTQEASLTGDVSIIVRSLPEEGTKEIGSLTGDSAAYNWKDRVATVTGNVTLKLKGRTITASKAVYNGREEKISLEGDVKVVNESGDKMSAPKATLVLKEGAEELSMEGGISSSLTVVDGGV